jgi:hypothetical protein
VGGFAPEGEYLIRRQLRLHGLIEILRETVSLSTQFEKTMVTETINVWRLTDYGRRQLRAMVEDKE